MGTEPVEQERPFPQGFAHQREVELFEVAQAAVDELAGPAGRAGGVVARFDQGYAQPAGGGVERHAATGDPTSDDEDIEVLLPELTQRARALVRPQPYHHAHCLRAAP